MYIECWLQTFSVSDIHNDVMRLDGNSTSWARCTKCRIFVPLVIVSLLTILYFGGTKVQVTIPDRNKSDGHMIGLSTLVGGLSKSGEISEVPQLGSINQEHYPTFEEDDKLPLPMHATSKFPIADFDPYGNDTLVVIHIQKTGGSEFMRHLVNVTRNGVHLCKGLDKARSMRLKQKLPRLGKLKRNKQKTINLCPRDPLEPNKEQWLISERTMGWICGVHASYTEFQSCLPKLTNPKFNWKRKLHYAVFLRHPVLRYISEFLHVQRNATWASRHVCHGKYVSLLDMPPCYPEYYNKKPWPNLTLSGFIFCKSNWANNRQTVMLANLESVGCFDRNYLDKEERERIILETAKKNLESFSFFGLTEYMNESCDLFERQFGVKFPNRPMMRNLSVIHSGPMLTDLWNHTTIFNAILSVNSMDMELYKFALDLFSERAKEAHIVVNKDQVKDELNLLQLNPVPFKRKKFKKLNYTIS